MLLRRGNLLRDGRGGGEDGEDVRRCNLFVLVELALVFACVGFGKGKKTTGPPGRQDWSGPAPDRPTARGGPQHAQQLAWRWTPSVVSQTAVSGSKKVRLL